MISAVLLLCLHAMCAIPVEEELSFSESSGNSDILSTTFSAALMTTASQQGQKGSLAQQFQDLRTTRTDIPQDLSDQSTSSSEKQTRLPIDGHTPCTWGQTVEALWLSYAAQDEESVSSHLCTLYFLDQKDFAYFREQHEQTLGTNAFQRALKHARSSRTNFGRQDEVAFKHYQARQAQRRDHTLQAQEPPQNAPPLSQE